MGAHRAGSLRRGESKADDSTGVPGRLGMMGQASEVQGVAWVNDHTAFRTDWMPFAGRRQSGYGVGGIPYTMHDMTHEKMIVLRY